MKTPQVTPNWNTGIYIGNGVVAVKEYTCENCGKSHTNEFSITCGNCDSLRESGDLEIAE